METLERFQQNERLIEDFTSHTLAAIPSDIARLLYVSRLRDTTTGRYRHDGLAAAYSEDAVHQALAYCHEELFSKTLETSMDTQERDLRACLAGMEGNLCEIAARWRELELYRQMVPRGVPAYLGDLFHSNLRTLLELIAAQRTSLESAA
jgi:hypothetical protein